jgi:hypothetical protein
VVSIIRKLKSLYQDAAVVHRMALSVLSDRREKGARGALLSAIQGGAKQA